MSKRLQGTYGSKKYKEIQQYIIDTLGKDPIIINNGLSVIIDNRDAQHVAHNAVGEKIAQIYHIKYLLTSATLFAEDKNVKHNKFDYFSYHEVYVKYKEDIYPVYFNIGKGISDKKHHVYDITKKIGDTANRINGLERPKPNEGYAQKTISPLILYHQLTKKSTFPTKKIQLPYTRQLPTSHIRITSHTRTMKARTLTQKKKTAHLIKVRRCKTRLLLWICPKKNELRY